LCVGGMSWFLFVALEMRGGMDSTARMRLPRRTWGLAGLGGRLLPGRGSRRRPPVQPRRGRVTELAPLTGDVYETWMGCCYSPRVDWSQ
jgi:hypothetical protein